MAFADMVFRTQLVTIEYRHMDGASFRSMRGRMAAVSSPHLNLNQLASTDTKLVLTSPTSSSVVEVHTNKMLLSTRFFGDFTDKSAGGERASYVEKKVDYLLDVLDAEAVTPLYAGVSTTARASAQALSDTQGMHRVKQAAARALGWSPLLSEQQDIYDFSMRVSRVVGERDFSNISVAWYQERQLKMQAQAGQVVEVGLWQMPVIDEGLEFKYDRNNKHGLFHGQRTEWSRDVLLDVIHEGVASAEEGLSPIAAMIVGACGQEEP